MDMMAFAFFLVWMLASLSLLVVWVFRQSPPAKGTASRSLASASDAVPVEG
jgi:cbb3-type cytochrome oxidase subunit 3